MSVDIDTPSAAWTAGPFHRAGCSSAMPSSDPLIVTAAFDDVSASFFQRQRDRHFPPALNIVPAHLTLFHKLPGDEIATVTSDMQSACKAAATIPFATSGLRFLGRGVAIEVEAQRLIRLRSGLATLWRSWLTRQDEQGFRAHVTIQNKVDPASARRLHAALSSSFASITGAIVGLDLWHYRSGPWALAARFQFSHTEAPEGPAA